MVAVLKYTQAPRLVSDGRYKYNVCTCRIGGMVLPLPSLAVAPEEFRPARGVGGCRRLERPQCQLNCRRPPRGAGKAVPSSEQMGEREAAGADMDGDPSEPGDLPMLELVWRHGGKHGPENSLNPTSTVEERAVQ